MFGWIDNRSVAAKLAANILLSVAGLALVAAVALAGLRDQMWQDRQTRARVVVEAMFAYATGLEAGVQAGRTSRAAAIAGFEEALQATRFDKNSYFALFGRDGTYLVHGGRAAAVGTNDLNKPDRTGRLFLRTSIDIALADPAGGFYFVDAEFYPGGDHTKVTYVPKVNFIKYMPTWDMFLVSGLVIDDVNAALIAEAETIACYALPVMLLCVGAALLVRRSVGHGLIRLAGAMGDLAGGQLDVTIPGIARRDEIGTMGRAVAVFKDNAIEKRRLERAREADRAATEHFRAARDRADAQTRAKSEFLATMSHEIRSPMSGLVGVLEMIRETRLDPEQARMAGMAHRSALVLLSVLNDILDFSKIEAGALTIAPEPTDLRQLAGELAEPHIIAADRKNIRLTLRCAPDIPPFVLIDPLRLRQILNNLLSNAIKFTAAGAIGVDMDVLADGHAPALCIAVRDSGIGMSEEVMARLFEPFMQADGSTTRNFGGTGLGLCISRRLALLLTGTLTVASRAGEGSVFTLKLPLLPADAPSAEALAPMTLDPEILDGRRVLVVDDDQTNRWLAQRRLERLGLAVDVAEDGDIALRMLCAVRYDLLLTDCHMPRMDGVALTRAARAAGEPWLRAMPIIGLTADVTRDQHDRCLHAGMTDVAIKPLASEKLVSLLARHLGRAAPLADRPHAQAAVAPDDMPVFDPATCRELFAPGDPEGAEWLATYLAAADALGDTLQLLFAGAPGGVRERRAIGETAHRLAGVALSAGATSLGHAARALEHQAAHDDPAALRERHAALLSEVAAARRAVLAFMAAPQVAAS